MIHIVKQEIPEELKFDRVTEDTSYASIEYYNEQLDKRQENFTYYDANPLPEEVEQYDNALD